MNYWPRWISAIRKRTSDLSLIEMGAYDRLLDHYYAEEKPLPGELERCYRLAGAVTKAEQEAVRHVLAKFFVLRDDSYHNERAEEEIQLAAPKIAAAQANGRRGGRPPGSPNKPKGNPAGIPPETQNEPRPKAPHPQPHSFNTEYCPDLAGGRAGEPPDLAGHTPTAAGAICRALRAAGIGNTNPGHPRLLALLDAGAAPEEFLGFAPSALKAGDPFAYLLGAVEGERTRAKDRATALHHGPMPVAQQPVSFRERERQAAEAQADAWGGPELAAFRRKPATNIVEVVDVTPKRLG